MSALGTKRRQAFFALYPELAKADIRAQKATSGFDPNRTSAGNFAVMLNETIFVHTGGEDTPSALLAPAIQGATTQLSRGQPQLPVAALLIRAVSGGQRGTAKCRRERGAAPQLGASFG